MTVRELARILSLIPDEYQDLKIFFDWSDIKGLWELYKDYPLGDRTNPNCKYEDVIWVE